MNIDDKADAIYQGAISEACSNYDIDNRDTLATTAALEYTSRACALLTSPLKAEREQGKTMVRNWRQASVSRAKPPGVE